MATRLILKDVKAPIQFLLRNPASSIPLKATAPVAQTIQNLLVPRQNLQSDAGALSIGGGRGSGLGELGLNDRQQSIDLKFILDGRFRIKARGKQQTDDADADDDSDDGDYDDITDGYYDHDSSDGDYADIMDDYDKGRR